MFKPFIKLPIDLKSIKTCNYPSDDEILEFGEAIRWEKIIENCGFLNEVELILALKTSISSLKEDYERKDLLDKLILEEGLHPPEDDKISILLLDKILKILSSKGAKKFILMHL